MEHSPSIDVDTLEKPLNALCVLDMTVQKLEKVKELTKKLKEQQLPIMTVDTLTEECLFNLSVAWQIEEEVERCFAEVRKRKESSEGSKEQVSPSVNTVTADVPTEPELDALYLKHMQRKVMAKRPKEGIANWEERVFPALDSMEKQLEKHIAKDAKIKETKAARQLSKAPVSRVQPHILKLPL